VNFMSRTSNGAEKTNGAVADLLSLYSRHPIAKFSSDRRILSRNTRFKKTPIRSQYSRKFGSQAVFINYLFTAFELSSIIEGEFCSVACIIPIFQFYAFIVWTWGIDPSFTKMLIFFNQHELRTSSLIHSCVEPLARTTSAFRQPSPHRHQ